MLHQVRAPAGEARRGKRAGVAAAPGAVGGDGLGVFGERRGRQVAGEQREGGPGRARGVTKGVRGVHAGAFCPSDRGAGPASHPPQRGGRLAEAHREGKPDSLRNHEVPQAIGLPSFGPGTAAGVPRVVAIFGVQGGRWAWARTVRALVFALDADAAGQQAWRTLARQAALRGKQVVALGAAAYGGART